MNNINDGTPNFPPILLNKMALIKRIDVINKISFVINIPQVYKTIQYLSS